jgi:hypothetical protein
MPGENSKQNCPENNLTWFQVNNWVPIIVCIVGLVFSYAGMISEQKLTNQKLDTYIANQNEIIKQLAKGQEINSSQIAQLKLDLNTLSVKFNK